MGSRGRPSDIERFIAGRLRDRRIELGVTQSKLAGLAGISHQQIFKYETGANRLTISMAWRMCGALDLSFVRVIEDFAEGTDVTGPSTRSMRGMLEVSKAVGGLPKDLRAPMRMLATAIRKHIDEVEQ